MTHLSFDPIKKREEILKVKKTIPEKLDIFDVIVYFLNGMDDIVYIGHKKGSNDEIVAYIQEFAAKKNASAYSLEMVNFDESIEDAQAERILYFQPPGNRQLVMNERFISSAQGLREYRITKPKFKRFVREVGGFEFKGLLFGYKEDVLNYFEISKPFDRNMPKVGHGILCDSCEFWEQINGKNYSERIRDYVFQRETSRELQYEDDGTVITTLKERWADANEVQAKKNILYENSWTVLSVLNTKEFKAKHNTTNEEQIFTIEEYITKWIKSYKEMDGFIGG